MKQPSASVPSIEPCEGLSAVDRLARVAPRLANVVEATSRKRDVRDRRAKLLLLLLQLACPTTGNPRRRWYVPGAVARVGAEGIIRAWRGFHGEEAPTLRTIRTHLGELEAALAIVASPGDWMPVARSSEHPERRPRYPNTYHLLTSDAAAEWWEREGLAIAAARPATRSNPDEWRKSFARWRERAARMQREPMLPFDPPAGVPAAKGAGAASRRVAGRVEDPAAQREQARRLERAAVAHVAQPLALLIAARDAGVHVQGTKAQLALVRDPRRFAGAVMLLARALARGDRVRNRAGWLMRAFEFAPEIGRKKER